MSTFAPILGTRVVAITGHARHGKDTLAVALLERIRCAERFAFSDLFSARERLEGRMTTRDPRLLQDATRGLTRDAILAAMYHAIRDRAPRVAIVTGIRNADEAQMFRDMGGRLVRVVRMEPTGAPFVAGDRDPTHPMERNIDGFGEDLLLAAPSGDLEQIDRFADVLAKEYRADEAVS